MTLPVDLNCDLGEAPSLETESAVMPFITSASIACGLHAGGAGTMRAVVRLAKQHGVAIGAHPPGRERERFGRREMTCRWRKSKALVWCIRWGRWRAGARGEGAELRHVKPHGALYNQAARDAAPAEAIVRAVKRFSRELIVVGLAGSCLVEAARALGTQAAAQEAFPGTGATSPVERSSRADGPAPVLEDPAQVAAQAVRLARRRHPQASAATLFPARPFACTAILPMPFKMPVRCAPRWKRQAFPCGGLQP